MRSSSICLAAVALLLLGGCDIFEEFPDEREGPDRFNLTLIVPGDAELAGRPIYIQARVQDVFVFDTAGVSVPDAGSSDQILWEQVLAPSRNYDLYYWVDTATTAPGECNAPDDPQWLVPFTSPADRSLVIDLSFAPVSATGECVVDAP